MRLELERVTAAYADSVVLRDVNLVVPSGSVVALLGPNGAGKTTLLSIASGLLAPVRGRVLVDGIDVSGGPPHTLVSAGMCHVTEGRSVFPSLTVAENLTVFGRRQDRSAVDRAIDAFPILGQRLSQVAGTMSGGEQQMLALARAYVQQSPLVLLDEVSMGLAPVLVDEIFDFLGRMAAEGHSLLVVEQFVTKALALADLVYVLVRGRIAFAGEPDELSGTDIFEQYLGTAASAASSGG